MRRHWLDGAPEAVRALDRDGRLRLSLPDGWEVFGERVREFSEWPATNGRQAWLVNVGTSRPVTTAWYVDGAVAFVTQASERLKRTQPARHCAKHLLALPLVGTGHGGAHREAGEVVYGLLPALYETVERHDIDVVLVTWEPAAFAAA